MDHNNPTAGLQDPQAIQLYTLHWFCNSRDFDCFNNWKIREISHYKEADQPGEGEVEHMPGSVVNQVLH